VDAAAEGQLLVGRAAQVQAVGLGELVGIPVGGAQHGHQQLPFEDGPAAQFEVRCRDPGRPLHRRVPTQQLLDGGLDQLRLVAQPRHLVGVSQEREGAVADQVDRGLVAGDQEQVQHHDQLPRVQLTDRQQVADEVVSWL